MVHCQRRTKKHVRPCYDQRVFRLLNSALCCAVASASVPSAVIPPPVQAAGGFKPSRRVRVSPDPRSLVGDSINIFKRPFLVALLQSINYSERMTSLQLSPHLRWLRYVF
jgi:hypothetical protein